MKKIKWSVLQRKVDATDRMVDVIIDPYYPELRYFFADVSLDRFPDLLDSGIKSLGFRNMISGLISHSDLDGGDFADGRGFDKGNVKIYHQMFNEIVVEEKLFDQILLDYASKLLEVYQSSKEVQSDWKEEMDKGIELLKRKIAANKEYP